MDSRQHLCSVVGCGKAFSRKEHLSRHEKTHDPENILKCQVCEREFNRNDSLQRHLARHGDAFKQNPSGRSKRACFACRTGKIKCDGKDNCSTCVKKGIECKYRTEDQTVDKLHEQQQNQSPEAMPKAKDSTEPDVDVVMDVEMSEPVAPTATPSQQVSEAPKVPEVFKLSGPSGLVDWSFVKVLPDQPLNTADKPVDPTSAGYLDIYFTYFHHRWPIFHRPSFDVKNENTLVVSSAKMIGAWLLGTFESRAFAITCRHEALVEQLLPRLCKVTSQDRLQQSLSLAICQSALLNIIFALYYGVRENDSAISSAIMLRNILITGLREVEFFKKETAWIDEKPGYFVPMRLVKLGSRQRLAAYLFKVDAYLSILRDQPATILPEELHFPLPSTFGLYNADGLHIWEERQANEPIYRSQKPIYKMITECSMEPIPGLEQSMLIEDIQTCICAMQSAIWKVGTFDEYQVTAVLQRDSLRRQLNNLMARLNQMFSQFPDTSDFGEENSLHLRYYFGFEDPAQPGWQNVVVARVKSLLFDAMMLYHLSSLQVFAEIRKIINLTRDRRLGIVEEASTIHRQARELRLAEMKTWGTTPTARRSLCHAVDILVAHQNISHHDGSLGLTIRTLDPVAHIAICVAGLVVWVYCTLDIQGCEICTPGGITIIELTRWSVPGAIYEKEKEAWIEDGNGCRIQLQGIQLCSCNVEYLMALFRVCLPDSWATGDSIVPEVFKFST
ncbi:hypothetical protein BKA65DRAFT_407375 [Rhexocercosporidium sp. MPI-PUGE-AT-0058]|nr:hypothetical protein BKA65DRAFT_407375 [Rhexocercosporidium sp. MPI-PUGE-AT-0058]